MNNKGFTLVELLGVIVIFSILVVVITISADSTLKKSKTKLSNTQIGYIEESAQVYYLKEGINNSYNNDSFKMCVNLDYLIENDYIENDEILDPKDYKELDGSVEITYKSEQFTYKYQENSCTYEYQSLDKICYAVTEETKTTGNVPEGNFVAGDEYICEVKQGTEYHFFVISTEDNKVNLIMNRNICEDGTVSTEENLCFVSWINRVDYLNEGGTTSEWENNILTKYGPITAIKYLNNATNSWINVKKINEIYEDESGNYDTIKIIGRARLPKSKEVIDTGCVSVVMGTCPLWMVDYLDDSDYSYEGRNVISSLAGYWLLDSHNNKIAKDVTHSGAYDISYEVFNDMDDGVRPVISVSKTDIY